MTMPYEEPLTPRAPGERAIPEPARRGEPGGEPCGICSGPGDGGGVVERALDAAPPGRREPAGRGLDGRRVSTPTRSWTCPRSAAASFGPTVAKVERAILSLGDVARVHLYRWGDGGAHLHVWMIPRPLGMLEAKGMMLPFWEDALPNVSDEELAAAAQRVAAAIDG